MSEETVKCAKCGNDTHYLATFPGGICLSCYEKSEEAQRPMSAEEIVGMFKGSVRR